MKAFDTIHKDACPHGIIVGVHLPEQADYIDPSVWRKLRRDEQNYAQTLKGKRKVTWIGGRIAAHAAANILGIDSGPILSDPFGAPTFGKDISLSITHKSSMALALAARKFRGNIGIDLEELPRPRLGIMKKVLTTTEMKDLEALPPENHWHSLLLRFSTKESIYKALAPKLQRHIGFEEAEVYPKTDGSSKVNLLLKKGPFPVRTEARYIWFGDKIITTVRVFWPYEEQK